MSQNLSTLTRVILSHLTPAVLEKKLPNDESKDQVKKTGKYEMGIQCCQCLIYSLRKNEFQVLFYCI